MPKRRLTWFIINCILLFHSYSNLNITDDNGNVGCCQLEKLAKAEARNEAVAEIEMDTEDTEITVDLPDWYFI